MINDKVLVSHALVDRGRYEGLDPFGWTQHPAHYVTVDQLGNNYLSIFLFDIQGILATFGESDEGGGAAPSWLDGTTTVDSLVVHLQVLHCGEPLTPVMQSSVSVPQPCPLSGGVSFAPECCPTARAGRGADAQLLNEWVVFPLRLCDLPLDAVVDCQVRDSKGGACLGVARFHPFELSGELRMGRLACELRRPARVGRERGGLHGASDDEITSYGGREGGADPEDSSTSVASFIQDNIFLESLFHVQYRGMLPTIPWLDTITEDFLHREARLVASPEKGEGEAIPPHDGSSQNRKKAYLRLYLPLPSKPIPILMQHTPQGLLGGKDTNVRYSAKSLLGAYAADANTPYADHYYLFKSNNICEAMAAVQARSLYLLYDTTAAPGLRERQRLMELAARPPVQSDSLRIEDVALLWKYRHFVCKDSRFFLSFLCTVDWSQPHSAEGRVATELIAQWKSVGLADVLSCLSRLFSGVAPVRQFAVQLLNRESNAKLCWLSVCLIQALRYESKHKELTSFLLNRTVQHWELCCTLYWGCYVEGALEGEAGQGPQTDQQSHILTFFHRLEDMLGQMQPCFLHRLRRQRHLINSLRELCSTLQQAPIDRQGKIELGRKLLEKMGCGFDEVFPRLDGTEARMESLRGFPLATVGRGEGQEDIVLDDLLDLPSIVALPCYPAVPFEGVSSSGFSIFKSSKLPVQVVFRLATQTANSHHSTFVGDRRLAALKGSYGGRRLPHRQMMAGSIVGAEELEENEAAKEGVSAEAHDLRHIPVTPQSTHVFKPLAFGVPSGAGVSHANTIGELPMMFKLNDDVRQDQLVLQLIYWMDSFLRQDGLDLCLTPYRVVATGPSEGLIEVVLNVVTFQSIQRDALKYLRQHNPTPAGMQEAMDRYKRSFAGYCVITFVLGIGDRHLENILLAQDGRLFHIDFGYILGNDPKPFPPPMKISREMIDVLGGPQSVGYVEFKSYCCSAYNILRKHAALFLHMLHLMSHARSLPQITGNGTVDPYLILMQVQDKLRLDLSNAQSTQYLQTVIADSVGSIFTGLWDALHAAAQATRV